MSIKIMSQVWEYDWEPIPHLILLAIADWADDKGGHIFPSIATVARKCKLSERTVQRAFSDFRKAGVLITVHPARAQKPAEYRLDLTRGVRLSPISDEDDRGDTGGGVTAAVERGDYSDTGGVTVETPNTPVIRQIDPPEFPVRKLTGGKQPKTLAKTSGVEKVETPAQILAAALVVAFNLPPIPEMNDAERPRLFKAAKLILQSTDAPTMDDITRRIAEYVRRWRGRFPTPLAVASMWHELGMEQKVMTYKEYEADRIQAANKATFAAFLAGGA